MSTISDLAKAAAGRCWDGYEPVPGKDAYSDDSCRKIGSKKKKKKSEKKAFTVMEPALTLGLGTLLGSAMNPEDRLRGAGTGLGVATGASLGRYPGGMLSRRLGGGKLGLAGMLASILGGGVLGGKGAQKLMGSKEANDKSEKKAFAPDTSFADGYDEAQLREALVERVRMIAQLRAHRDALLDDKSGYKKAVPSEMKASFSRLWNKTFPIFRIRQAKDLVPAGVHALGLGAFAGAANEGGSVSAKSLRGAGTGVGATLGAGAGLVPGMIARRSFGGGGRGLAAMLGSTLLGGYLGGKTGYGIMDGFDEVYNPFYAKPPSKVSYAKPLSKKSDDCHCYPGGPADPDKKGCKDPDCDHCGKATKKAFTTPSATPAPKMSPGYKPTPSRGGNLSMGRVAYNTKPPATGTAPAGRQLPSWVKKQYQDPAKYKFIPSEYANSGRMVNRQTGVVEQSYDDPKALQQYLNNIMKKRGSDIQELAKAAASAAWQRKAGKNSKGGLNEKGRKSYERENPGSDLKAPVTGKVKPGGKAAKRRKSFCARMKGNKGPMKKPNGEPTRKALALRKWKC